MSDQPLDLDRIARVYVKIRDARAANTRAYEEADEKFKADLKKLENVMLGHLNSTGSKSVATESGTFYKQEEILPTGSDWDAFYDWIKDNDAFDALERRVKKGFIREYMEANNGAIPPGITVLREFVVRVRRGKGDAKDQAAGD